MDAVKVVIHHIFYILLVKAIKNVILKINTFRILYRFFYKSLWSGSAIIRSKNVCNDDIVSRDQE